MTFQTSASANSRHVVDLGDALKRNATFAGRFALTGVAAAAMFLAVSGAWAMGLGRLQVQSALGEPLRAEIDVTSLSPEETANLRARVASPESYRSAGVDYNPVLPGTQVELRRRPDGRPFLRLTSDRGVQEPFVDVILEINWATGRLVREYTLLFDPPTTARAPASAPAVVAVGPVMGSAAPVPTEPPPSPSARTSERRAPPMPAKTATEPPASSEPKLAAVQPTGGDQYRVKPGDSLSRIASRTLRPGVSLDQMLVSLYRGNPEAFLDNNMNRLKSGVVLSVPGADAAKMIPTPEARQVIQAQSADFGAYRQRLAAGVPETKPEGSSRQASGKVEASVTDRQQTAGAAPDKLTLSKGAGSAKSTTAEDRISKDREKKSDDARVAQLSKNVDELKKLSVAAASSPATSARPAVAQASSPVQVPAAAPVAAATAVVAALPAASTTEVKAPTPPVVVASAVPPAASAPRAPASAASAGKPPVSPVVGTDPGVFGSLLDDNPMALGLGGLALALLAGFGVYRFAKRSKSDSGETSFLESRLQPDSFFGASGGQRIDTRDAAGASSSMSYSLSQLDAIGDVDPVAEADVYLAYGRDLQAEEILKEAMRSTPDRMAIRTKLLEVYAKRRDTKGFELLATQLFALTRGEGEDWAKAQEMGAQIDPENPLFKPGGVPVAPKGAGGEIIEALGATTMPQSVLPSPSQFGPSVTGVLARDPADSGADVDLDLDLGDPETGSPTTPAHLEPMAAFEAPDLVSPDDAMNLDFSFPDVEAPAVAPTPIPAPPGSVELQSFDLSDISFDLDLPETLPEIPPAAQSGAAVQRSGFGDIDLPPPEGDDDPLSRKLDLAEEFRQIGDTDGARDLLHEVVAKASGAVKTRAEGMLATLG